MHNQQLKESLGYVSFTMGLLCQQEQRIFILDVREEKLTQYSIRYKQENYFSLGHFKWVLIPSHRISTIMLSA